MPRRSVKVVRAIDCVCARDGIEDNAERDALAASSPSSSSSSSSSLKRMSYSHLRHVQINDTGRTTPACCVDAVLGLLGQLFAWRHASLRALVPANTDLRAIVVVVIIVARYELLEGLVVLLSSCWSLLPDEDGTQSRAAATEQR